MSGCHGLSVTGDVRFQGDITLNGQVVHDGPVERRLETLQKTLEEHGDRRYIFSVELVLPVPGFQDPDPVRVLKFQTQTGMTS